MLRLSAINGKVSSASLTSDQQFITIARLGSLVPENAFIFVRMRRNAQGVST